MLCKKCKSEIPDGSAYCNLCGARQAAKTQNRKSRGNGTGSVYQLPNKTWIARVTLGYTVKPGGGKQKHTRSKAGFKTKRDAVNYLPKLLAEPERRKDITLKAAFDTWIPDHEAGKSTINNYKACANYFKPLWFVKLRDIGIDDLQECIDDCGKSRSSQEKARACISLTYKWALPRYYVPHGLNLAEYLKVGGSSGEKPGLPLDAVRRIRANAGKVSGADLVLCQCLLGFRPSEMLILTVSDYDPVHRLFVGGMKTEKGRNRSVTVSPIIQPYVDRLVSGKAPEDAVFTLSGQPMSIAAYRDLFYSVLDACGIDNPVKVVDGVEYHTYTPHSCRHTFATLMKRVDGADKDKLELIGHTSTEMLRHYQDVDTEDLRRITDQFTL